MSNIFWRDVHWKRFFLFILWIPLFSIFLVWILRDFTLSEIKNIILMVVFGLLLIYLILGLLLPKATYITKEGIRVGNIPNDIYTTIRLKQKPTLVKWKEIREMKIIKKAVRHNFLLVLRNFLVVSTTDRKRYETFLANQNGFKETLTKLNKSHLLKK